MFTGLKTVFMHEPIGLPPIWSSSLVEHKSLPQPYDSGARNHRFVSPRCFPESSSGGSAGASSTWMLPVLVAEQVPLPLLVMPLPAPVYISIEERARERVLGYYKNLTVSSPWTEIMKPGDPMVLFHRDRHP